MREESEVNGNEGQEKNGRAAIDKSIKYIISCSK